MAEVTGVVHETDSYSISRACPIYPRIKHHVDNFCLMMNSVLSITFMSDDDFGANVGLESNFHKKKHTLMITLSCETSL